MLVDESGFNTAMSRGDARAPSHQRAWGRVPRNHGRNQTLICALHSSGPVAPLVITGAVNGPSFEWYIRALLCPSLRPGQVVIMENLSSHHRASVRTLIEARGCRLLFVLPYSPALNPIELMFSKIKAWVRAGSWRTVDDLLSAIWTALAAVTSQEVAAWLQHAHPSVSLC